MKWQSKERNKDEIIINILTVSIMLILVILWILNIIIDSSGLGGESFYFINSPISNIMIGITVLIMPLTHNYFTESVSSKKKRMHMNIWE